MRARDILREENVTTMSSVTTHNNCLSILFTLMIRSVALKERKEKDRDRERE